MGDIRKRMRPTGRVCYEARWRYKDEHGRPQRRGKTFRTKAEAERRRGGQAGGWALVYRAGACRQQRISTAPRVGARLVCDPEIPVPDWVLTAPRFRGGPGRGPARGTPPQAGTLGRARGAGAGTGERRPGPSKTALPGLLRRSSGDLG